MLKKRKRASKLSEDDNITISKKIEKNLGKGLKETLSDSLTDSTKIKETSPTNMLREGQVLVGLTKGCTINMGNYQSAKIDVHITRVCKDSENDIMDNLVNISSLIDEHLDYETSQLNESGN